MSISSICLIDKTLSGAILQVSVDLGVMAMKEYSTFFQTGSSILDGLMSYPGYLLGESYPFAEMQSVYSTAPAN